LQEDAPINARFYNLIFAGSTWCRQKLEEKRISWVQTLIQGVDPDLFFPIDFEKPSGRDKFIIFSGGKFELRKGQDLVLRAVKILQDKYDDIVLMNLWQNPWKFSFETMKRSPYIKFVAKGETWEEIIKNIMAENGMDPEKNIALPPINNNQLKNVYANTDIGIFSNRCEGGTNLVLMEYMACARPVIASYNTGHSDILTKDKALLLEEMKPHEAFDEQGKTVGVWQEPDLDELVSKLEYAYLNRNELHSIARQAGDDMKKYTWHATAKDLLEKIDQDPEISWGYIDNSRDSLTIHRFYYPGDRSYSARLNEIFEGHTLSSQCHLPANSVDILPAQLQLSPICRWQYSLLSG